MNQNYYTSCLLMEMHHTPIPEPTVEHINKLIYSVSSHLSQIALMNYSYSYFISLLSQENILILNSIYNSHYIIGGINIYMNVNHQNVLNSLNNIGLSMCTESLNEQLSAIFNIYLFFILRSPFSKLFTSFDSRINFINTNLDITEQVFHVSDATLEMLVYRKSLISKIPITNQISLANLIDIDFEIENPDKYLVFLNSLK